MADSAFNHEKLLPGCVDRELDVVGYIDLDENFQEKHQDSSSCKEFMNVNAVSDAPKRSKRLRFAAMRYEDYEHDDEFYLQKIQELVNQKLALCADQYELREQVQDEKRMRVIEKRPRLSTEEDDKKKKIRRRVNRMPTVNNEVTERLKEFITQQMNGSDLKLVIQKTLYSTDLTESQNRLSMPINQLETHEFLTMNEKRDLENGKEFKVPLLGPTLQVFEQSMVLKMWHLKTTNNYVLKTNWNRFVKENKDDLKENTKVQVWSFRIDEHLWFALACVERADGENAIA